MNRAHVLKLLAQSKPTLVERCGATDIALFGSTVRDTARSDSDINVPVSFDGPATSERYFASGLNCDATVRSRELIGEAATHVPDAFRAPHPQVDNDTLWTIVAWDVPALLASLRGPKSAPS